MDPERSGGDVDLRHRHLQVLLQQLLLLLQVVLLLLLGDGGVLSLNRGKGRLLGVFDIDSDRPDAFTKEDADALADILKETFAAVT